MFTIKWYFSPILRDTETLSKRKIQIIQLPKVKPFNRIACEHFIHEKIVSSHFGNISFVCRKFTVRFIFRNRNGETLNLILGWIEASDSWAKPDFSNRSEAIWFLFVQGFGAYEKQGRNWCGFSMEMSKTKLYRCTTSAAYSERLEC